MIDIREERSADLIAIREINTRAFGQTQEADIVDALRSNRAALVSLVAVRHGRIVGHIMYSPASVGAIPGAALGPMAVLPECRRQGIGSQLVAAGNRKLGEAGCPFVVVVGHAQYYPRFGFRPARSYGISCEWDVPDDVCMILLLNPEMMRGVSGVVKYRPESSSAR